MTSAGAEDEDRHAEPDHGDALADLVTDLAGLERADHAEADADQQAEHERDDRKLERHRRRLADQRRDGLLRRQRDAEVAAEARAEPGEELLHRRLAEPVEVHERRVLRRREEPGVHPERRSDRVAGQQAQDDEDDDRHPEQGDQGADGPPGDRQRQCTVSRIEHPRPAGHVGTTGRPRARGQETVAFAIEFSSRVGGSENPWTFEVTAA